MKIKTTIWLAMPSLFLVLAACSSQASAAVSQSQQSATSPQTILQGDTSLASKSEPVIATKPAPKPVPTPAGPIRAREITPQVAIDSVSIPVDTVLSNWNSHFLVDAPGGTMGFMAYVLNDQTYVRASICPPCRGKTYTLNGNTLVCDTCGTTFDARTGIGIAGACVNYPKASVPYDVSGGNIVMKITDLKTAYQNTLKPGLP